MTINNFTYNTWTIIDETRKGSSNCSWGPNVTHMQTIFAKQTWEYEYLTALSNSVIYVSMTMTYDTWIISIGDIMICSVFGINTTSDISKLLYFLFQLVKDPTRIGNILDMVFVTSFGIVYDQKVGLPFSDHNSISMLLSRKSFSGRKSQKLSYHLRRQTGIISGIFYITLHGIVLLWMLTKIVYVYMGCMVWFVLSAVN